MDPRDVYKIIMRGIERIIRTSFLGQQSLELEGTGERKRSEG